MLKCGETQQHQHKKNKQQHQEKNQHERKTSYGKCRQGNIRSNGH